MPQPSTGDVPEEPRDIRLAEAAEPEARRKRNRNIALGIAVAIVIIIVVALMRHRAAASAEAQKEAGANARNRSVAVSVAPVQVQDVPVYLDGLGNVNALNTVVVKTRIDGQLLQFNFREGQVVHAGDEIALIDPRPSEAQLAQAQATKFKDEATLENSRHDLERYAQLVKQDYISKQQYDTQVSQVRVGEGNIEADNAQIRQAQLNVSYCHIKAPITGQIGLRNVDPGNMVHASDPNGLVVITQMQPIAVLFTLPEDSVSSVAQHMAAGGLPVEAWSRDGTQKIAVGRLMTIDNQIDPNTGTFRCKAVFDNRDGALFPNQFVDAKLQVDVRHNVLVIPTAAIQHGAQGTYVYVVLPNKTADMRPVTASLQEGTISVIDSGVNAGDQVVLEGADKLQPHGKVELGGTGGGGRGAGGGGRRPGGGSRGAGGGAGTPQRGSGGQ